MSLFDWIWHSIWDRGWWSFWVWGWYPFFLLVFPIAFAVNVLDGWLWNKHINLRLKIQRHLGV